MKMTRREKLLYNAELFANGLPGASWQAITDAEYATYVGDYEWLAALANDEKSWFILFLLEATK